MSRKVYDDVEVHDMSELHTCGDDASGKSLQGAPVFWKALAVVVAMMSVLYGASPIDAVPDGIPVLGVMDDLGFMVMAALNLYQQFAKDQNSVWVKLAKYIKWIMVLLIVIAGVAVGGLIAAIIALVT